MTTEEVQSESVLKRVLSFCSISPPNEIHPFLSEGFPFCDINLCVLQELLGSGVACWEKSHRVRPGAFSAVCGQHGPAAFSLGKGLGPAEPP